MEQVVVFAGPTISHEEVRSYVPALCLPPVVQGSLVSAYLAFKPSAFVIIDGAFQSEPAIRHNEILWATCAGIPVLGAASMGALRAAELYPHMTGVGLIYRWYRRYPLAPDDAVAVVHGPEEVGFAPVTEAAVDLRRSVQKAVRSGFISADIGKGIVEAVHATNFRQRNWKDIVSRTIEDPGQILAQLHSFRLSQKLEDARAALDFVKRGLLRKPQAAPFAFTQAFVNDLEAIGIDVKEIANI